MYRYEFDAETVLSDKQFGAVFDFSVYDHLYNLGPKYEFLEGLGSIESDNGEDLIVYHRGDYIGVIIPQSSGLWVKNPGGAGWQSTMRFQAGNNAMITLKSLKSRDKDDLVDDVAVAPFNADRSVPLAVNLFSRQAEYYFMTGPGGEQMLRNGTFLDVSSLPG